MKLFFPWLLSMILFPLALEAQRNPSAIIDTVETSQGTIILYKNYTWEFLQDEPVMMSQEEDSTGLFTAQWVNDQIFAYRMKPDSVRDTVLMLTSADRNFTLPYYGKLFRGFTYSHKGLDIRLNKGDTVKAAFDGVVRYAKYNRGGFGNLVIIRHYNGLETYYGHNSKLLVKVNQVVKAGDPISLGGSTGRSRGPHLHFEVRYKDIPMDPFRLIDYDNQKLISNTFPVVKRVFYPEDHVADAVVIRIKSGDTVGKLSRKYHTSIKEICAMNKIRPNTKLKIGRSLRVR
ncbi:MAG TPA: peptidoglycan DD-metalloendopeptidase family protein [Bacteroidales bacterium]|nr:peptidoglycan DD-metalloendopeptidase family protein [Bacteroidales bacterium]HPS61638.1 peptidoglycan DD-metalloendopeptidase family protein [Bacteroidales bacterium]